MASLIKRGEWYSIVESYRDPDGKPRNRMVALHVKDKRAALSMLATHIKAKELGQAGILDKRKADKDKSAVEWLDTYLADLSNRGTSPEYIREVGRVLRLILTTTRTDTIRDFTPAKVREYLTNSNKSAATKNMHRAYVGGFFSFLTGDGKPYETSPFTRHSVPLFKAHQRRAARRHFRLAELSRLLNAAETYPLAAKLSNTGGRPRADGTPARPRKAVNLTPTTRTKLSHQGRERRLIYRTALLTGLRRGELSRLLVSDVFLGTTKPRIVATLTKNKRQATIPLVPGLAVALSSWIKDTKRKPGDRLFNVPCVGNLSRLHKAHMRLAGIPYQDANGVPATFHSLRRTINVLLRKKGVPLPERMRFLRHAARDLTTKNYDDTGRTTMSPRVFKLLSRLDSITTPTVQPA